MRKVIIIVFLFAIIIVGINVININKYSMTNKQIEKLEEIKKGLKVNDLIVTESTESDDYLEYKNIKINNLFTDFECSEEEYIECINDDKKTRIELTDSYIDRFIKYDPESKKILKEYNINTDLELLGKIKELNNKPELFKHNKYNYIIKNYAIDNIKKMHSIDLLEGDINGLMFHTTSKERVVYIYSNETYSITLNNFSDEEIKELLNSIILLTNKK